MTKTIQSGNRRIARPALGAHDTMEIARTVAKLNNLTKGRGYRAVKSRDGRYAVIFQPVVASNKQRRVRVTVGV